jgi:hypothetical protein
MEQIDPFADTCEIKPRPLEASIPPAPEPITPSVVLPEPSAIAPRHIFEKDGCTEADRLLQAIITASRKENPNHGALRVLCSRFSREHALDF